MPSRTWVSGVGDDANPGSRTAPCKTFAGALSKTTAPGEINVIDPGGFGSVTITKSITIDGAGTFASILAAGTAGININAGAGDIVTLRNLSINGSGTGTNGIRFLAGAALFIENCVIFGFTQKGILIDPAATTCRIFIRDTIIRNNNVLPNGGGIFIQPGGAATVNATLDNVTLAINVVGLSVADRVTATIRNSLVTGHTSAGLLAKSTAGPAFLHAEGCEVVQNDASASSTVGVASTGPAAIVTLSNCTVIKNGIGLNQTTGGTIGTFGNNRLLNNISSNGAFNGAAPLA